MRRTLLGAVLLVAVAPVLLGAAGPVRNYSGAKFGLEIDGTLTGFLKSVEGGGIKADVIEEPAGSGTFVKKHIGMPKYEEITVRSGIDLGPNLAGWAVDLFGGKPTRKDGAVITCNYDYKAQRRVDFRDALLTEFSVPALDGASKETAYFTIEITPELLEYAKEDGDRLTDVRPPSSKVWLSSNFRVQVGDLPCTRVAKVDGFTIKQSVVEDDLGEGREFVKVPGRIEIPNLHLTISAIDLKPWMDWHEDFVVKGNNSDAQERSGSIVFLASNMKDELGRIDLDHVGIFEIDLDKTEADKDAADRFRVRLYVEKMELILK